MKNKIFTLKISIFIVFILGSTLLLERLSTHYFIKDYEIATRMSAINNLCADKRVKFIQYSLYPHEENHGCLNKSANVINREDKKETMVEVRNLSPIHVFVVFEYYEDKIRFIRVKRGIDGT